MDTAGRMRGAGALTATGGTGPQRAISSGRGRAPGGATFRPAPGDAAGSARRPAAPAAAVGIGGPAALLALQEAGAAVAPVASAGTAAERDRRARRRGAELLEALRVLQLALLKEAAADADRLTELATLAGAEEAADPVLREAIAAIVLRARVELARRAVRPLLSRG
jgi:hypothetical protein